MLDGDWYAMDVELDDPFPDNPDRYQYTCFNVTDASLGGYLRDDIAKPLSVATGTRYAYEAVYGDSTDGTDFSTFDPNAVVLPGGDALPQPSVEPTADPVPTPWPTGGVEPTVDPVPTPVPTGGVQPSAEPTDAPDSGPEDMQLPAGFAIREGLALWVEQTTDGVAVLAGQTVESEWTVAQLAGAFQMEDPEACEVAVLEGNRIMESDELMKTGVKAVFRVSGDCG